MRTIDRNGLKNMKDRREDFLLIGRTLQELREPPSADEPASSAEGDAVAGEEQLELF